MSAIDEILVALKDSQFEKAHMAANVLARDQLIEYWQNVNAARFAEPCHYPAARLLQAYALAGLGTRQHQTGIAVVSEELGRLKKGQHMRVDFIIFHYIALATAMVGQKGLIAEGLEFHERLVDRLAFMTASRRGGEKLVYAANLRDEMALELGLNTHQMVQASISALVAKLSDKRFCLQGPVANSDYYMPMKTPQKSQQALSNSIGGIVV